MSGDFRKYVSRPARADVVVDGERRRTRSVRLELLGIAGDYWGLPGLTSETPWSPEAEPSGAEAATLTGL